MLLCTVIALAAIAWGALFLIAPVWQFSGPTASYTDKDFASVSSETIQTDCININLADAETLMMLPGIGPAKAEAILAWREAHGPFSTLMDLEQVSGISSGMIESWEGLAYVGSSDTQTQ
ncbi:hypothetical protein SUBVAR_04909 [Subdoligranulum variabile DSM 15176]|uniref:ComEA protein n=1 Tax=Subdoligranulum variabile DSM 15176 TaxID=411471 RepID=D1PKN2_9FIRM|nr:hypothetical protein SUBVAR_04909 [Subdoligranulum variabile DSM 15176]